MVPYAQIPYAQKIVAFTLTPGQMSLIDDNERRVVEPGEFEAAVGGGPWPDRQPVLAVRPGDRQPGYATNVLTGRFAVIGTVAAVE